MTHLPTRRKPVRILRSRALLLAGIALAAAACQDGTTGPVLPGDAAAPRLGQAAPYYCITRTATPGGVREAVLPLSFPPEALASGGATMPYSYRRQTPAGVQTYSAECVVPRTMSALELMNQRFRVPAGLGSPRGRDGEGNEFTTQGCVSEGECLLDPIVVVAPKEEDEHCERALDGSCQGSGGGGTSYPGDGGGGAGGGGGSGVEAMPSTNDDLPELNLQQGLNCSNPGSAQEKAFCIRAPILFGTTRYQRTKDAIERIRSRGAICATIAEKALTYLDSNSIGVYAIEPGMSGGYGVHPHGLAIQDRWVDIYYDRLEGEGRNLDWIIVHETEHAAGQLAHSHTDAGGVAHTANDNLCAGL